jgi:imidazolonepropionase-like amidohydrolase
MVGRLFSFKNLTAVAHYPPTVLIIDEDATTASFLDELSNKVKVSKFYFRSNPEKTEYHAEEDALTDAISLIGELNEYLAASVREHKQFTDEELRQIRSESHRVALKLRSLKP